MEIQESGRREFFLSLENFAKKYSSTNMEPSEVKAILRDLYADIQQSSVYSFSSIGYKTNEQCTIQRAIHLLLCVIMNEMPAEVTLLGGTCLISLVFHTLGKERTAYFFIYMLSKTLVCELNCSEICDKTSENAILIASDMSKIKSYGVNHFPFSSFLSEDKDAEMMDLDALVKQFHFNRKLQYVHLVILHGLVSQKKIDCLTYMIICREYTKPFLILIFPLIYSLCTPPSEYYFHAFQLVLHWTKCVDHFFDAIYQKDENLRNTDNQYFSQKSEILRKILNLLEANWESPISGVSEAVKNIYKIIFHVNIKENLYFSTKVYVHDYVVKEIMKLSWEVKGKYIVLSTVLQHINIKKLLQVYPDVPFSVIMNMKANYIVSAVSEVYKILVLKIMKSYTKNALKIWQRLFAAPIMNAVMCDNELLRQNVKNYILLWTMKNVKNSYEILLESASGMDMAKVIMLRKAKEAEIISDKHIYVTVKNLLHHSHEVIRMEIFATLCFSNKKAEALPHRNLIFIKEFISANLNIDNNSFCHEMIANLKTLFIRIRDSCTNQFVIISKKKMIPDAFDKVQVEFIEWLGSFSLENSMPGACYQRRRMCLQIISNLFEIFIRAPCEKRRKDNPSSNVSSMISWLQNEGYWSFFSGHDLKKIFCCIFDFNDDIRLSAADILQNFYPWPTCTVSLNGLFIDDISNLLKHSLELCEGCSIQQTETGSLLCRIVFEKYILDKNMYFEPKECILHTTSKNIHQYLSAISFISEMVIIANRQLLKLKENLFIGASTGSAVHGTLLAIQYCISGNEFLKQACKCESQSIFELLCDIIFLCQQTVNYMLSAVVGKGKSDAPSFAEIGQALHDASNSVVHEYKAKECFQSEKSTCGELQDFLISEIDGYSLSEEFQILLSCYWHSIKNSCTLIGVLAQLILKCDIHMQRKKILIQQIVKILSSVLLKCRHRGVIEACSTVLNNCCKSLIDDNEFTEVPLHILKEGFNALFDATSISVTRRSAGLAYLIQSVVSCEQKSQRQNLASFAVKELLSIIKRPMPCYVDDKYDLPHAHAYHIMKMLILDSSMSDHMIQWSDHIFSMCMSGFNSNVWAIRNGALQLFGALLPRLCGQKKIKEDISEHNMISPSQLFMLCPSLHSSLEKMISTSIDEHQNLMSNSFLIPLMSVIVKLSPVESNINDRIFFDDLRPMLLKLLESPLWQVRNMAATGITNTILLEKNLCAYGFLDSFSDFQSSVISDNKLNGIMLTIKEVISRKNCSLEMKEVIRNMLIRNFNFVIGNGRCSEINRKLYLVNLRILTDELSVQDDFTPVIESISLSKFLQVLENESERKVPRFSKLCNPTDTNIFVKNLMFTSQEQFEASIEYLYRKLKEIESNRSEGLLFWRKVLSHLLKNLDACHTVIIHKALEFILNLLSHSSHGWKLLNFELAKKLEKKSWSLIQANLGVSVTACCIVIASLCFKAVHHLDQNLDSLHVDFWIMLFYNSSHPQNQEILRMQAAEFVAFSGWIVAHYLSLFYINCYESSFWNSFWEGIINLLQDENDEIRRIASTFASSSVQYLMKLENHCIQSNIAIWGINNITNAVLSGDETYLQYLWNKVSNYPSTLHVLRTNKLKKSSLFVQETMNIYSEPLQISVLYYDNLNVALKELHGKNFHKWQENVKDFASLVMEELNDVRLFINEFLLSHTDIEFWEYVSHPMVYLALTKLNFQAMIVVTQKLLYSEDLSDSFVNELELRSQTVKKNFPEIITWHVSDTLDFFPFRLINSLK